MALLWQPLARHSGQSCGPVPLFRGHGPMAQNHGQTAPKMGGYFSRLDSKDLVYDESDPRASL